MICEVNLGALILNYRPVFTFFSWPKRRIWPSKLTQISLSDSYKASPVTLSCWNWHESSRMNPWSYEASWSTTLASRCTEMSMARQWIGPYQTLDTGILKPGSGTKLVFQALFESGDNFPLYKLEGPSINRTFHPINSETVPCNSRL